MRRVIIAISIILALSGGIGAYFLTRTSSIEAVESTQQPITVIDLFNEVNAQRRLTNLPELMLDPKLNLSACDKLSTITDPSKVTHDNFKSFINDRTPDSPHVGENMAQSNENVSEVVRSWMDSKGHRENILMPDYERVGYCVGTLNFTYLGRENLTAIVQHFAN